MNEDRRAQSALKTDQAYSWLFGDRRVRSDALRHGCLGTGRVTAAGL